MLALSLNFKSQIGEFQDFPDDICYLFSLSLSLFIFKFCFRIYQSFMNLQWFIIYNELAISVEYIICRSHIWQLLLGSSSQNIVVNLLPDGNNARSCWQRRYSQTSRRDDVSFVSHPCGWHLIQNLALPFLDCDPGLFTPLATALINLGKLAVGYELTTHQLASWIRGCVRKFSISLLS